MVVEKVTKINNKGALFILLVESHVILTILHSVKFHKKYKRIIISGYVMLDVDLRKFVKKISLHLKLPVLPLMDGDSFGFSIMVCYKYGAGNTAYDSENMTTPNLYGLGVRPSDIETYNLHKYTKFLTEQERTRVQNLLDKPYVMKQASRAMELFKNLILL
ncbi:DNA topoisomerase 6 subunit A-like [Vicia villosa]|uniref:DNA topoisomerase 6 subunit A-like n=1 Tax=Vicia villosa TaxID=3911 RepID=UPI00273AF156|nr:DNA topoisomerase 6 subunit A-like [Vicia villosa]